MVQRTVTGNEGRKAVSRTSISLPIRNDIPLADQCSHGKTWKEPCIDCEIVSMTEWLRTMEPRIQRDRATLDRLLAERASLNGSDNGA